MSDIAELRRKVELARKHGVRQLTTTPSKMLALLDRLESAEKRILTIAEMARDEGAPERAKALYEIAAQLRGKEDR